MIKRRGLDSMIRLHRWRLAETRQTVAELERFAARLRHELSELDKLSEDRSAGAIDSPTGAVGDDPQIAARRAKLALSLADVEGRMRGALSAVAQAVRDIKKYDVVKAHRERAMKERDRQPRQPVSDATESQTPRQRQSV